jgi:cell division control protein 6
VFSRVFESLFGYEPPASGISFTKLFEQVADRIVGEEEVLVVALDDVNYLYYENEASDTLYSLLRAHEAHAGAKVGAVVVSSDLALDTVGSLDGRVQSVFRPEEAFFPVYDGPEIADILGTRVDHGFREGAVPAPVLDRVTELTAETGDLRVGIDLLRRAGLNAEMRASAAVAVEDVEEAYDESKHLHLSRRLEGLSEPERALLAAIADNDGDQAGEVYETFHRRTDLGYTRYSELVNKLDRLDLIDAAYEGVEGRGRSRSLSLSYDADAVREQLGKR